MNIKSDALIKLNKALDRLTENGFSCLEIIEKDYHYESSINKGQEKFKLLYYFGKKGLKKVIQGNISSQLYDEVLELISEEYGLGLPRDEDESGGSDHYGEDRSKVYGSGRIDDCRSGYGDTGSEDKSTKNNSGEISGGRGGHSGERRDETSDGQSSDTKSSHSPPQGKKFSVLSGSAPPSVKEPEAYIGTDESGKGDFFGPIVSAAFYVDSLQSQERLKSLGVRDSKELSDKQIRAIAINLRTEFEGKYNIISINPARYNEMYIKILNINKILNWQHSKAIEGLLEIYKCKTVITDKFSKRELNVSFKSEHDDIEFIMLTKAERFTGVAAASILARDTFNLWFERMAREGRKLPKGNAPIVETAANKIIEELGRDELNNFVKLHFKTTLKLK
jgi:ribonuclease HIII